MEIQNSTSAGARYPSLKITTTPAKVDVQRDRGRVEIDGTACREAVDMRDIVSFVGNAAALGQQQCQKFIDKTVADGNEWQAIENKTPINEIIAGMAERSAQDTKELTLKTLPLPKVTGYPGSVKFEVTPGSVDIEV